MVYKTVNIHFLYNPAKSESVPEMVLEIWGFGSFVKLLTQIIILVFFNNTYDQTWQTESYNTVGYWARSGMRSKVTNTCFYYNKLLLQG